MGHAASAPLDQTAQKANLWLEDIAADLGVSSNRGYEALTATLHVLRDCLSPDAALHLADQLPPAFRGAYLDGWNRSARPACWESAEEFVHAVQIQLPIDFPVEAEPVAQAVIDAMLKYMEPNEVARVVAHLPEPTRVLWTEEIA
jgi:uncharacterized protein (DUF2267 family)